MIGLRRALAALAALCTASVAMAAPPAGELVYIATPGTQIHAMRFNPRDGTLTALGPVADAKSARWSVAHPRLPVLYSVNDKDGAGNVSAYAIDSKTGALAKTGDAASGGAGPTHLWFDAPSSTLFVANFAAGSVSSIAVARDGTLGPLVSTVATTGSGPHRRQTSPHAHGVALDPSGKYLLVADLGADRVYVHGFDRGTRKLSAEDAAAPRAFVAPAGSGPRHLAFDPAGRIVYLLNELNAELQVLRWVSGTGRLTLVQTQNTNAPSFTGTSSAAEIAVSRDGRFVYATNRGDHALLVYRVERSSGRLTLAQRVASGGELPWAFGIHRSGKWMLVANQRSNEVRVFARDPASGKLADTGRSATTPLPVGITFDR